MEGDRRQGTVDVLRRLARHKGAMSGGVILVILMACIVFAPYIAPHNPLEVDAPNRFQAPSMEHWFGTDEIGRDILSRVIFGSRISLSLGLIATSIALSVGVFLGLMAGYSGGVVDSIISRFIDVLLSFPYLLLAMLAVFALGPSLTNAMVAVGIVRIPAHARVTRGAVLSTIQEPYVESARALGAPEHIIMFRHVLPNVIAPNIVIGTLGIGTAILTGAGLSFLGLGAQPPDPEWGLMLSQGRGFITQAPWLTVFPGIAIALSVLSINLVGDALRDVLDPRLRT